MVELRRVYDRDARRPGEFRVLVDRIWPRGITKASLELDAWLRDVAPSNALRRWYGHEPARWPEFRKRYLDELARNPGPLEELRALARRGRLVLLYSARDREHNQAVVLQEALTPR